MFLLPGMLLSPFLIVSIFLPFSQSNVFGALSVVGYMFLALSVGSGIYFVARLPISRTARVVVSIVYVPILLVLLMFYSMCFIGAMTGVWL
jgi:hypothetical protein